MLRKYLASLIAGIVALIAANMAVYMGISRPAHANSQAIQWERMKWIGAWHGNTYATQIWCDLQTKKEIYVSLEGVVSLTGAPCK